MENGVTDPYGVDEAASSEVKPFVDMFEEAEQSNQTARDISHRCRDYLDGTQLSDEEISELAKRGQPAIVINRIRRKINWLRGVEMQGRTDPRAFPRTPQHEQGAEAATDAIRYVCDNADWSAKRSRVWENILVEGFGGVEVVHKFKPPMREPEICINYYSFDRLFYDPHSTEPGFSDARYKGAVIWSDMDELARQHPDKKDIIEASLGPTDVSSETFEDKPYYQIWTDPKRRRARCVLLHYRKGDRWHWVKFVKGGVLEQGESPYFVDGESVCPLIMQSAYVSRENDRYGEVKDMLDPQDEINKRRSKLLHQLNARQTASPKGAFKSVKAMKRELAKPDGHVEYDADQFIDTGIKPFEVLPTTDQTAGQFSLLQEAKSEIDLLGANSALQGTGQGSSGREVIARQQGGMIEITPLQDNLSQFTQTVFRHVWGAVRQFWTEEKWIRVTDDVRNTRFVGLNRPVSLQERLAQLPREQVVAIARQMGLGPGDPRLQQPVGIENRVEEIDVDIILDEVEDQVTLAGETFEQLVGLSSSMPGAIPPEILIEAAPNLDRSVKDKLLERMEQQAGQNAQMGEAQMELEAKEKDASAMKDMAQAQKYQAEAQRAALGY